MPPLQVQFPAASQVRPSCASPARGQGGHLHSRHRVDWEETAVWVPGQSASSKQTEIPQFSPSNSSFAWFHHNRKCSSCPTWTTSICRWWHPVWITRPQCASPRSIPHPNSLRWSPRITSQNSSSLTFVDIQRPAWRWELTGETPSNDKLQRWMS